jgi:phage repressor protein C with HTH and peptisase S24 domain
LVAVRRVRFHANAGILGWSVEMQEEDAPPLFFRKEWFQRRHLSPEQLLGVKVRGSSMEPGLFDGDTVVVNRAENRAINGQVFAVNYEGECVIKRLKRDAGEWWLTSDNADKSRYPDQRVGDGVSLIGRVIYKSSERV